MPASKIAGAVAGYAAGSVSFLPVHRGDGYEFGGGVIATIGERSLYIGPDREDVRLAHLIAASPELLAALRGLARACEDHGYIPPQLDAARAAIVMAEGR